MIAMTDDRLAALLAEHDRLGARVLEIRARLDADERALDELARTGPARAGGASTLAEIKEREGLLATGSKLSAEGVRRAGDEREAALRRRAEIVFEVGDSLPEDEWVASGEWALLVSREYRGGPRILCRALALAVERHEEPTDLAEILSLSADAEASGLRGTRVRRFLFSHPRVGKVVVGALALAALVFGLAGMLVSGAHAQGSPPPMQELLLTFGLIVGMAGCIGMFFWGYGVVSRGEISTGEQIPVPPTNPGEFHSGRLTAAHRLPDRRPGAKPTDDAAGSIGKRQRVKSWFFRLAPGEQSNNPTGRRTR